MAYTGESAAQGRYLGSVASGFAIQQSAENAPMLGPLAQCLSALDLQIQAIGKAVEQVEQRLAPYLIPVGPENARDATPTRASGPTPLIESVMCHTEQLERITSNLMRLDRRIVT